MPAPQLHLSFGLSVADRVGVPAPMRRAVARAPHYARLGAIVHDLPYYGNMALETARYFLRTPADDDPWAYRMHSVRPARFVASFLAACATTPGLEPDERQALAAGILSHCALDLALHPLVNYCARRDVDELGGHETVRHRMTEKYHALFFHAERAGGDPIGTPAIREWTRVTQEGNLVRARAEESIHHLIDAAYRGAYHNAPHRGTWARWVRSFRHFGVLASGPIAAWDSKKLLQPGPRRDALRARYVENATFSLWDFYAVAETRLVELCTLGAAFLESGDTTDAAQEAWALASRIDDLAEPKDTSALPPLPHLSVRSTPGRSAPAIRFAAHPAPHRRDHTRAA